MEVKYVHLPLVNVVSEQKPALSKYCLLSLHTSLSMSRLRCLAHVPTISTCQN